MMAAIRAQGIAFCSLTAVIQKAEEAHRAAPQNRNSERMDTAHLRLIVSKTGRDSESRTMAVLPSLMKWAASSNDERIDKTTAGIMIHLFCARDSGPYLSADMLL